MYSRGKPPEDSWIRRILLPLFRGRPPSQALMWNANPSAEYTPSEELKVLILQHSQALDERELEAFREQSEYTAPPSFEEEDLLTKIGDRVEGLFSNLAERAAISEQSTVRLSDKRHLYHDICEELGYRLGIDPNRSQEVFDRLHDELAEFTALATRERSWGQIVVDENGIKLEVDPERAVQVIDLDQVDPSVWRVTE